MPEKLENTFSLPEKYTIQVRSNGPESIGIAVARVGHRKLNVRQPTTRKMNGRGDCKKVFYNPKIKYH